MREGLLGRDEALRLAGSALERSTGDMTEVSVRGGVSRLTRFSDNYIHQNVSEAGHSITVKVIFGQKAGTASTNSMDEESIDAAIRAATQIAGLQKPNPEFPGLPGPSEYGRARSFFDSTLEFGPMDRARAVKVITDAAAAGGFRAAGAYTTGANETCIVNSLGLSAYHASTSANLRAVVMSDTGSGYADAVSNDSLDVDAERVASEAVELCAMNRDPEAVVPGEYEVVLQPRAVGDMLGYLIRGGFSAAAVLEGRSFLAGRLGQKMFPEAFSLWDDGLDPAGFPVPFDLEGVPKKKVVMVEKGVPRELLYDFKTAVKQGKQPTGHGGLGGWGPMASNVFMAPGQSTLDDLVGMTRRGILITRLNYTNMAHPVRALVTGTTRDGTFLIEDGKVRKPVKNFRFTESALRVFGSMDAVTRDVARLGRGGVVPAIHVPAFNFTGVTEF